MALGGYITCQEAANRFGLSDRRWRQLAKAGKIEATKHGGRWWIIPDSCKEYLKRKPRRH